MKKTLSYFLHALVIITAFFYVFFTFKNNSLANFKLEYLPKFVIYFAAALIMVAGVVVSLIKDYKNEDNSLFVDACMLAIVAVPFAHFTSGVVISAVKGLDYLPYLTRGIFVWISLAAMVVGFIFNRTRKHEVLSFIFWLTGIVAFTVGTFVEIEATASTTVFLAVGNVFGAVTYALYAVMAGLRLKGEID